MTRARFALTGIFLALALPLAVRAAAPTNMIGPPIPAALLPPSSQGTSLVHPAPPALTPVPGADIEAATPVLAPPPENRKDTGGSVTCFACPEGQDTFHGAICMNGIACAAEGVTLQQLGIGLDRTSSPITSALRKLEAARAEVSKMKKGEGKTKALQYINTALTELKAAGLKAGCKNR